MVIPRTDLSVPAPEFESPPGILLLISVTIKAGMGEAYAEYLGKLAEATRATAPASYGYLIER